MLFKFSLHTVLVLNAWKLHVQSSVSITVVTWQSFWSLFDTFLTTFWSINVDLHARVARPNLYIVVLVVHMIYIRQYVSLISLVQKQTNEHILKTQPVLIHASLFLTNWVNEHFKHLTTVYQSKKELLW